MKYLCAAVFVTFLVVGSSSNANAAGSDLDDCILDITMQCVDDDDFWGCYDIGVELCENQSSSQIQIPKGTVDTIKRNARTRAQQILLQNSKKTR